MNADVCRYCNTHRYSIDSIADDVCDESPTGYHRVDRVPTWRDSNQARFGNTWLPMNDWAALAFTREGEGVQSFKSVPTGLRRALVRLWSVYPDMPKGFADPMYVANVIANEVGFGDGHGNFTFTSQLGGE